LTAHWCVFMLGGCWWLAAFVAEDIVLWFCQCTGRFFLLNSDLGVTTRSLINFIRLSTYPLSQILMVQKQRLIHIDLLLLHLILKLLPQTLPQHLNHRILRCLDTLRPWRILLKTDLFPRNYLIWLCHESVVPYFEKVTFGGFWRILRQIGNGRPLRQIADSGSLFEFFDPVDEETGGGRGTLQVLDVPVYRISPFLQDLGLGWNSHQWLATFQHLSFDSVRVRTVELHGPSATLRLRPFPLLHRTFPCQTLPQRKLLQLPLRFLLIIIILLNLSLINRHNPPIPPVNLILAFIYPIL
jgi:hypothetical protein